MRREASDEMIAISSLNSSKTIKKCVALLIAPVVT